jgi:hypothetical protein
MDEPTAREAAWLRSLEAPPLHLEGDWPSSRRSTRACVVSALDALVRSRALLAETEAMTGATRFF